MQKLAQQNGYGAVTMQSRPPKYRHKHIELSRGGWDRGNAPSQAWRVRPAPLVEHTYGDI
eukprot:10836461-Karenia_brevis.AAC.1